MMQYVVRLDWKDFRFDNAEEATFFAQTAKEHFFDDDKEIDVTISLVKKEEE